MDITAIMTSPLWERWPTGRQGRLEVLARQRISPTAPPHPFTAEGHDAFNALLQTRPGVFPVTLLVGDATLWSSTAGGLECLRRLWTNVLERP